MDKLLLFKDMGAQKWAFQWRNQHFWTNLSHKTPMETVINIVSQMNPQYEVVVRTEKNYVSSQS